MFSVSREISAGSLMAGQSVDKVLRIVEPDRSRPPPKVHVEKSASTLTVAHV